MSGPLSEEQLREVFRDELARSQEKLRPVIIGIVEGFADRVGLDYTKPMEQQADFAHLRKWRHNVESAGLRIIFAFITVAVTGAVGAVFAKVLMVH